MLTLPKKLTKSNGPQNTMMGLSVRKDNGTLTKMAIFGINSFRKPGESGDGDPKVLNLLAISGSTRHKQNEHQMSYYSLHFTKQHKLPRRNVVKQQQLGVSKNRGTPKWMVYNGKPLLKWMIWEENLLFLEIPNSFHPAEPFGMKNDRINFQALQSLLFSCDVR